MEGLRAERRLEMSLTRILWKDIGVQGEFYLGGSRPELGFGDADLAAL